MVGTDALFYLKHGLIKGRPIRASLLFEKEEEIVEKVSEGISNLIEEIELKYGAKARRDIEMLLDAYLRGNVSDTDVCKLYYRNRVTTFADAFKEAERVGVKEVVVYNRNRKYITDTPYFEKSMENAKKSYLYTSSDEIESFHFRMDEDDSLLYIYFERKD